MKILLVDDDRGLTQLLQLVFESRGFNVIVAHNGIQALRVLEKESVKVIVLDLMMPDMNGLEVCKRIQADPELSDTPVVVLTAKTDEKTRQQALEAGADKYLIKPIRPSDILTAIRQVCTPVTPLAKVLT